MALRINANSLMVRRFLTLKDEGVVFAETTIMGGQRKFSYGQIDHVLMSQDNVLSFQVGHEVFSLQTKPKHQLAIKTLVESSK